MESSDDEDQTVEPYNIRVSMDLTVIFAVIARTELKSGRYHQNIWTSQDRNCS